MFSRTFSLALVGLATGALVCAQQERGAGNRIHVDNYAIDAEINPRTQVLSANVQVKFTPLEDNITSASFELNNALNVSRIIDDGGRQIQASRNTQDFSLRLSFPNPLPKGKQSTLTFTYDGRLNGTEDSPVYGINFAAIHNDFAYLMYPARWFPVNDYAADRFSADLRVTVPQGQTVIASGSGTSDRAAGDKVTYTFHYAHPSFPGSIAVVQGNPVKVDSQGVLTNVYFRSKANMANAYGEETGKVMTYLSSLYGPAPRAGLTLIETENGTPNGYSAPEILFLSPKAIGDRVGTGLLANQISRQWWGTLVSPVSRNHIWLSNGSARYAEMLYTEHTDGPAAFDLAKHSAYVEALTVENPPVIQSARLEDYSPEYWAVTGAKGAAILNMLRFVMGDDAFFKLLREFPDHYSWRAVSTEDFRKDAEQLAGQNLAYFFIQWIESSGAPEFKQEYTVFRTQKGFRVMGKISQDLDTFRMPVELKIETEGNPEEKRVEVVGTSSEFSVDTFGKPKSVTVDPNDKVLRYTRSMRVAVAIRRGEQFAEISEYRRRAERVSEGAGRQSQQLVGALPRRPVVLHAE